MTLPDGSICSMANRGVGKCGRHLNAPSNGGILVGLMGLDLVSMPAKDRSFLGNLAQAVGISGDISIK
jgi:hypothetical protein